MLAEFKIINHPLRPSVCTNLCSVCYRDKKKESNRIGCCSYEPEFCLFDLVFLYLHYPTIYEFSLKKGQIIKGYNGIMVEMKTGLNRCPFISDTGCTLPRDAMTPICRLYICQEAALWGPSIIEERFNEYFSGKEFQLNNFLNGKLTYDKGLSMINLSNFIKKIAPSIKAMIAEIDIINLPVEIFHKEIVVEDFGILP